MPQIVLNDGTILNADAGKSGEDTLWIWMRDPADPNNDLIRLGQALSNPGATAEIIRIQDGESTSFSGYTELRCVKYHQAGLVCARLERSPNV